MILMTLSHPIQEPGFLSIFFKSTFMSFKYVLEEIFFSPHKNCTFIVKFTPKCCIFFCC